MSDTPPELGAADMYLVKMLRISRILLTETPGGRDMTAEEMDLFVKGARALGEMFIEMHTKIIEGAALPTMWGGAAPSMDKMPTSQLHQKLKAAADLGVMRMIDGFSKLGNRTGLRFTKELGELMVTLSRFTSESVRLACQARLAPEAGAGNPNLMVLQRPEEPVTKSGRSIDQEDPDGAHE